MILRDLPKDSFFLRPWGLALVFRSVVLSDLFMVGVREDRQNKLSAVFFLIGIFFIFNRLVYRTQNTNNN